MTGHTQGERTAVDRMVVTAHQVEVPLDWSDPDHSERITVFAREVIAAEKKDDASLPAICWFQGGPGFEIAYPESRKDWLEQLITRYKVVLLDQRGTGMSTPLDARALPRDDVPALTAYLRNFRADSIIRDADRVRAAIYGEDSDWHIFGQSFGGFCVTAYLSIAPEGLREALITGGLPPIGRPVDDVYGATYRRVLERNRRYYERYPEDRGQVRRIHERLQDQDVRLPSGDRLTSRRFRQLGSMLGASDGAERLHYLVELPPDSPAFLHDVESATAFARNPIYAVLHEACYADGCATRWSAERLLPADYAAAPELFTGEHVYPWMFSDYGALAPLRQSAMLLAEHPWPRLYDAEKLTRNEVPAAAAIYLEDMYVERQFSEETMALVPGLRGWLTNEYEHNGLRADGARILDRLIDLARGRA